MFAKRTCGLVEQLIRLVNQSAFFLCPYKARQTQNRMDISSFTFLVSIASLRVVLGDCKIP
jgi:hypothetical protein